MKTVLKLVVSLYSLALILIAFQLYFIPDTRLSEFNINYSGAAGLSTIRGNLGGMFGAVGLFMLMGLRKEQFYWFLPASILIITIITGRIIGLYIDGYSLAAVESIAIELVLVLSLLVTYKTLKHDNEGQQIPAAD